MSDCIFGYGAVHDRQFFNQWAIGDLTTFPREVGFFHCRSFWAWQVGVAYLEAITGSRTTGSHAACPNR
jgi:hypothetical protein